MEIKHDDKLTGEEGVFVQTALLYTHRSGQRRLRVLNLALNVGHQLADVYRSAELDTMINFLTKQGIFLFQLINSTCTFLLPSLKFQLSNYVLHFC